MSWLKTIGMNAEEEERSFRSVSGEEKTTARSLYPPAAKPSDSNKQHRKASASMRESAHTIRGAVGSFSSHDLTFALCVSTEGVNSSLGSSGVVTDAHACHCWSREWAPASGDPICSANQPCAAS